MAANAQPIFVGGIRNSSIELLLGSTTADGSGTIKLFQADVDNGSRVHAISAVHSDAISTASVIRLWIENATNYHLISEIPVPLYNRISGVPAPVASLLDYVYAEYLDPADRFLTLAPGDSLYASLYTTIESPLHITAWGGDY